MHATEIHDRLTLMTLCVTASDFAVVLSPNGGWHWHARCAPESSIAGNFINGAGLFFYNELPPNLGVKWCDKCARILRRTRR